MTAARNVLPGSRIVACWTVGRFNWTGFAGVSEKTPKHRSYSSPTSTSSAGSKSESGLSKRLPRTLASAVPSAPRGATWVPAARSGMAFDFDAKSRRVFTALRCALRFRYDFDRVHRFGLHPSDVPHSGMTWLFLGRYVSNRPVRPSVAYMRRTASRIPIQKETRPAVMMHGNCFSRGWNRDFQHPDKLVFENDFMGVGSRLNGVISVRKAGRLLPVDVEVTRRQRHRAKNQRNE